MFPRLLPFALAGSVLLASCDMDCVSGSGPVIERRLDLPELSGISVEGSIDVKVEQGPTQAVVVEGQAEVLDLIGTDVDKGTWKIRTGKCYTTDRPFVVHLTVPTLKRIAIKGSGDVEVTDVLNGASTVLNLDGSGDVVARGVNSERVIVTLRGSGNVELSGTASNLDVDLEGSGNIHAPGLGTTKAEVVLTGSGNLELSASEKLDARVDGSGNVRYHGQPVVKSHVEGSGTVAPAQ